MGLGAVDDGGRDPNHQDLAFVVMGTLSIDGGRRKDWLHSTGFADSAVPFAGNTCTVLMFTISRSP